MIQRAVSTILLHPMFCESYLEIWNAETISAKHGVYQHDFDPQSEQVARQDRRGPLTKNSELNQFKVKSSQNQKERRFSSKWEAPETLGKTLQPQSKTSGPETEASRNLSSDKGDRKYGLFAGASHKWASLRFDSWSIRDD